MDAALNTLRQAGYTQATLWVLDTNARGRQFYEAGGWAPSGVTKQDGARGFLITELRYRRELEPIGGTSRRIGGTHAGSDLGPCFSWDAVITGTHWRDGRPVSWVRGLGRRRLDQCYKLVGRNLPMLRTEQWFALLLIVNGPS